MAYTLEQLSADIRGALKTNSGDAGKQAVCGLVSKVLLDKDFVASGYRMRVLVRGILRSSEYRKANNMTATTAVTTTPAVSSAAYVLSARLGLSIEPSL